MFIKPLIRNIYINKRLQEKLIVLSNSLTTVITDKDKPISYVDVSLLRQLNEYMTVYDLLYKLDIYNFTKICNYGDFIKYKFKRFSTGEVIQVDVSKTLSSSDKELMISAFLSYVQRTNLPINLFFKQ
jgi:hypothetical protein